MLHTPVAQITTIATACVVFWAVGRGRWPERVGGLAIALDCAGTILFQDHRHHHHLQVVWFWLDSTQAIVFLALGLFAPRLWTLWAAAFSLLLVLTHVTFMLNSRFGQWSYLTAVYVWGVGLLLALGVGVACEGRKPAEPPPWLRVRGWLRAARPSTPSATARTRS